MKKMIVSAKKIKLHISFILIWHEKEIYSKSVKQIYEKRDFIVNIWGTKSNTYGKHSP
jgi:hypothetical protein